jgi:hypothetical protein
VHSFAPGRRAQHCEVSSLPQSDVHPCTYRGVEGKSQETWNLFLTLVLLGLWAIYSQSVVRGLPLCSGCLYIFMCMCVWVPDDPLQTSAPRILRIWVQLVVNSSRMLRTCSVT